MEVKNLKDLQKLIKLLRATGVESMRLGDIELKLGSAPHKAVKHQPMDFSKDFPEASIQVPKPNIYTGKYKEESKPTPEDIPTDELTPEQLMFYSVDNQEQQ